MPVPPTIASPDTQVSATLPGGRHARTQQTAEVETIHSPNVEVNNVARWFLLAAVIVILGTVLIGRRRSTRR